MRAILGVHVGFQKFMDSLKLWMYLICANGSLFEKRIQNFSSNFQKGSVILKKSIHRELERASRYSHFSLNHLINSH